MKVSISNWTLHFSNRSIHLSIDVHTSSTMCLLMDVYVACVIKCKQIVIKSSLLHSNNIRIFGKILLAPKFDKGWRSFTQFFWPCWFLMRRCSYACVIFNHDIYTLFGLVNIWFSTNIFTGLYFRILYLFALNKVWLLCHNVDLRVPYPEMIWFDSVLMLNISVLENDMSSKNKYSKCACYGKSMLENSLALHCKEVHKGGGVSS